MSNWPNIQEYRNFEAKFFNSSVALDEFDESDVNGDVVKSIRNELIDFDDSTTSRNEKISNPGESKTVRCVIRNDFDEKFARGDGALVNHREGLSSTSLSEAKENATAASGVTTDRTSVVDSKRLENHFKWKKQKEEEYARKKLAEKLAQQRRKEEELLLEKLKKQKEKEREEKIREWQEQKAREKEGKKREKIVMKVLEEELKEAIPVIDKEKLIEDWVKLKDKQRQIDAEKKAEMLKREEESRALRQSLAALSYRQWKEKIKGKNTALPKNGYQIFGPKPVPVVKEDWNHNFISNSPRGQTIGAVGSKSSTATNIMNHYSSHQYETKESENSSLNMGRKKTDLKTRSPSFYHLKNIKSGLDLTHNATVPFKEFPTGTFLFNKNNFKNVKETANANARKDLVIDLDKSVGLSESYLPDDKVTSYLDAGHDFNVSPPSRLHDEKKIAKKIDLYINSSLYNPDNGFPVKFNENPTSATNHGSKEKKKALEKKPSVEVELRTKSAFKKKTSGPAPRKTESFKSKNEVHRHCGDSIQAKNKDGSDETEKFVPVQPAPSKKNKAVRKSKSDDRPAARIATETHRGKVGGSSSVKQTVERKSANGFESKATKSPTGPKRRMRRLTKSNSVDGADGGKLNVRTVKKILEDNGSSDANKKSKKKTPKLCSYGDSPYSVKRTPSKSADKSKNNLKKKTSQQQRRERRNEW